MHATRPVDAPRRWWRWLVPVGLVFCVACAGRELPQGPASGSSPPGPTRDQLDEAYWRLNVAVTAGDEAMVSSLLTPETRVRLPDGRAATALEAFRAAARELGGEGAPPTLIRAGRGTRHCTGAVEEAGQVRVVREGDVESGGAVGFRYRLVWEARAGGPGEAGEVVLREVVLAPLKGGQPGRLCVAVGDSVFQARRGWVSVHLPPMDLRGKVPWRQLSRTMTAEGWVQRQNSNSHIVLPDLVGRAFYGDRIVLGGHIQGAVGEVAVASPQGQHASLRYTALGGGTAAGLRRGSTMLLAGPAFAYMAGEWFTPRGSNESWNGWTIGAAAEVVHELPLNARLGIDVRLHYRWLPGMPIPGYLESPSMSVALDGLKLTAGLGARLW